MGLPVIKQVESTRESLPIQYAELLEQNPLLGRIEGQCRLIGWTDEEIRTVQLLTACRSNASLKQSLDEANKLLKDHIERGSK